MMEIVLLRNSEESNILIISGCDLISIALHGTSQRKLHIGLASAYKDITIGYILLLVVAAIYKLEYLIDNAFTIDYKELGKKVIGIYVVVLAVYFISALLAYSLKYAASRKRLARYFRMLRKLNHIYLVEDGVVKEDEE
jgi:hypothetical protein